ncbi:MAG: triose-phosphate isomerase [Acidobacteria bacterium]|nr:triose-phosphate isomerase [Acidobacteriota bacterium]
MRNRYLIANWKMNLPPEGMRPYLDAVGRAEMNDVEIVVAPPFPYLRDVTRAPDRIFAGAQNCADQKSGAFTGEVSAWMLQELGVRYALVGHSERRALYGETDALLQRKLTAALEANLTPVLCVGEDLRVREAGHVARHLAEQIRAVTTPALESAREVVIAYEPVWAIGTGRSASGAMVAETVADIRDALARFWPVRYRDDAPILYGGSVTPDNVTDLQTNGGMDGYLVGGASLSSEKFLAIFDAMKVS